MSASSLTWICGPSVAAASYRWASWRGEVEGRGVELRGALEQADRVVGAVALEHREAGEQALAGQALGGVGGAGAADAVEEAEHRGLDLRQARLVGFERVEHRVHAGGGLGHGLDGQLGQAEGALAVAGFAALEGQARALDDDRLAAGGLEVRVE